MSTDNIEGLIAHWQRLVEKRNRLRAKIVAIDQEIIDTCYAIYTAYPRSGNIAVYDNFLELKHAEDERRRALWETERRWL